MKKRLLSMMTASVFALLLCACAEKPSESGSITESPLPAETQAAADESSTVSEPEATSANLPVMTLRADGGRNCTLLLQNDSDTAWNYGADFHIYTAEKSDEIPFKEGIAVNALGYSLPAHGTSEFPINLDDYYDDLPEGDYRMEMRLFNFDTENQHYELSISTPFTLP